MAADRPGSGGGRVDKRARKARPARTWGPDVPAGYETHREGAPIFFHTSRLQFESKPDKPDPVYAHKLQELIGGAYGEMTVTMQYLFQGWNCRMPGKYKDLIMDVATEEIGHVEMIATMVAPAAGRRTQYRHHQGRRGRPGGRGGAGRDGSAAGHRGWRWRAARRFLR
jgi:Manganese containing catalase